MHCFNHLCSSVLNLFLASCCILIYVCCIFMCIQIKPLSIDITNNINTFLNNFFASFYFSCCFSYFLNKDTVPVLNLCFQSLQ